MNQQHVSDSEKQNDELITSSVLGKWFPRGKRWRTIIFTVVVIAAVATATNSIIKYENTRKIEASPNGTPIITITPSTITSPQFIENRQTAYISDNKLVLVITPINDEDLNNKVTDTVIEAANNIQDKDNIPVGVYILPKDESATSPSVTVRVLHHDATRPDLSWTIREDITTSSIYETYLNFVFIQ